MRKVDMIRPSLKIQEFLDSTNFLYEKEYSNQDLNMIYLDKNENPYGLPLSNQVLLELLERIRKYPDPNSSDLISELSKKTGLSKYQLIAGSGSDELLDLTFRTYLDPGDKVLSISPTFSMYKTFTEINGADYLSFPLELYLDESIGIARYTLNEKKFLTKANHSKIIILARPNNPDGNLISKKIIKQLLTLKKLTIIDEAYIDFSDKSSVIDLVMDNDNLIIIRSFSKSYALAGIRLGYAISNPSIISVLSRVKSPFNVNVVASQLGRILISSEELFSENVDRIKNTRAKTIEKLLELRAKVKLFYIHLSQGNFILIRFQNPKITESIYKFLLKYRIKVRIFQDWLPECLRISIGTEIQMKKVIEAFKIYFGVKQVGKGI